MHVKSYQPRKYSRNYVALAMRELMLFLLVEKSNQLCYFYAIFISPLDIQWEVIKYPISVNIYSSPLARHLAMNPNILLYGYCTELNCVYLLICVDLYTLYTGTWRTYVMYLLRV